jgi:hypothetical protein
MCAGRRITPHERNETLQDRIQRCRPWHAPPQRCLPDCRRHLVSAARYKHEPIMALSAKRLDHFSDILLACCARHSEKTHAWCVLPDHD